MGVAAVSHLPQQLLDEVLQVGRTRVSLTAAAAGIHPQGPRLQANPTRPRFQLEVSCVCSTGSTWAMNSARSTPPLNLILNSEKVEENPACPARHTC